MDSDCATQALESAKICSLHFNSTDYDHTGKRLLFGVLPFYADNNEPTATEMQERSATKCDQQPPDNEAIRDMPSTSHHRSVNKCDYGEILGSRVGWKIKTPVTPSYFHQPPLHREKINADQCQVLRDSSADIDTVTVYPTFDFEVFVVPHSHNDPGWLETFENYFKSRTKNILNNIVSKLHQYPNMTFIWTEISFLNAWWESSHPVQQKALKKLIKEGRLEITSGGWVMPDEACTHIYAIIDQFIEGHQWVKNNLDVNPKTGWSIDPFGHGPTVPYLLDQSGLEGTIIQRIHYAWKQWLALRQVEEFYWVPGWSTRKPSLIVHNQPFDIYTIRCSCGPHPLVCLNYDFRMFPFVYNHYTRILEEIEEVTEENLHIKSKTLIEEYDRIGSLTPHNVVLVPLGDDFSYSHVDEFDSQYVNYNKMFNYINSHKELFNAEVQFGTPLDYFNAVKKRHKNIPTLKGDFFVYSDIFTKWYPTPSYWSGYYTTRPYLKILTRQLEHQLRTSEILFTLVSNHMKQLGKPKLISTEKRLEKSYEQLINARRNLGLLQHHDAITGTSKASVIYDYGTKISTSLDHCVRLQEAALTALMIPEPSLHSQGILHSDTEWEPYGIPPKKLQITYPDKHKVIVFNPLAEQRTEVITVNSNTTKVRIYDFSKKEYVQYQISPNFIFNNDGTITISKTSYDVLFVACIPGLTAITYNIEEHTNKSHHSIIFCKNCNNNLDDSFSIRKQMEPGNIQLENSVLKLSIDRNIGFLSRIYRKNINKQNTVEIRFGAYRSALQHSGAYLFMPDYSDFPEKNFLEDYLNSEDMDDNIILQSGPVSTEIKTMYLPFLIHTVRIYNVDDKALSSGVFIETKVDFEDPPKNSNTELYMRIHTDIQNGELPEFYTDQNGFQYQKRVKVKELPIEANYYPITTMAWLQDSETRLTLVTDHAQGASAFEPGRLEVMMDRRTLNDDFRGLGEGIADNKPTTFRHWLLLESISQPTTKEASNTQFRRVNERHSNPKDQQPAYQLPSQTADYLSRSLNYPLNVYLLDTSEVVNIEVKRQLAFDFPPGLHLVTLRTITDDILDQFPSSSCFMVLQRPGYTCYVGNKLNDKSVRFSSSSSFIGLGIKNLTAVSLTGLQTYNTLSNMADIELDAMEVKTYKIWF